tara:strand:+ start:1705 stop:2484 length:780 start_codon:yes stop_codon:yes gene_type:complete
MQKLVSSIFLIINAKTFVITFLAIASTLMCRLMDFTADFPLTLVISAVVFPIVFSINAAYTRRETALSNYGSLKAHGHAIYLSILHSSQDSDLEVQKKAQELLGELIRKIQELFISEAADLRQKEMLVYNQFSLLSFLIKDDMRGISTFQADVSQCDSHLTEMMEAFETMKHIFQYRTPQTLRTFSRIFITTLPVLYAPYFAFLAADYSIGLALMMPVLFTVTLVSLDNIQLHLENPFDQIGEDDIHIDPDAYVRRLSA